MEIADVTHNPYEWAVRNERQQAILEAVSELDEEFRLALALRELHGYSYQEISEVLGVPIGTVKSKIFRARQMLQEHCQRRAYPQEFERLFCWTIYPHPFSV